MSNNHGQVNQSPNRNRDPFEVAKEEFLKTLAADKNIPSRQRATLFKIGWALAMHANREVFQKHGFLNAWPGLNTLAKELAMEKRTIHYGVRTLTALKYLGIALGKQGRGASNSYCLNYKKGVEPTNEKGVEPTPFPDPSGKGVGDAKKESATQEKVSRTHEKGVGPTTDMLNIPDDVPAEEPEHNLYSNRATVGSGTVLGTAPLRSAVSERLPQDPKYDLYKIAEREYYRDLREQSPLHPQEGEGEDMDTDQPTGSEVSPHTHEGHPATSSEPPLPPLCSVPLSPAVEPTETESERDARLARELAEKRKGWWLIQTCLNCGHVVKHRIEARPDLVDWWDGEAERLQCLRCQHRGMKIDVDLKGGREERDRRDMAQVKKGSELFNGASGQFRPIQSNPIQQDEDTRVVPTAPRETVAGSFDEYPDRYFLDDDPDYEPPSPEPNDYDPADYADLAAAK